MRQRQSCQKTIHPPSPPERISLSLSVEFHQTFKTYISQILFKQFEKKIYINTVLSYEVRKTLISNLTMIDPISFMSLHEKILNKI